MPSIFVLVVLLVLSCVNAYADGRMTESLSEEKRELEWRYEGKKLAVVSYGTNLFKPYVRELYTLSGENVLRDAPSDHLHHHGLMYAIRVNGVNFWEEKEQPGVQRTIGLLNHSVGTSEIGLLEARCTLLILWLTPTNSAFTQPKYALLVEKRTLVLTVDEKKFEVALAWKSAFEVGPYAKGVTLGGSDYNGLGMRFPESFDRTAIFQNSEGAPYPGTGKERTRNVTPAQWTSVAGEIEGRKISVALFSAPQHRNGNYFFTLLEPFAYLSATQGLDRQPYDLEFGDKYELNYLVTVYPETKGSEFLNNRYHGWQKSVSKK